jgi:hypothetical protein
LEALKAWAPSAAAAPVRVKVLREILFAIANSPANLVAVRKVILSGMIEADDQMLGSRPQKIYQSDPLGTKKGVRMWIKTGINGR